MRTVVRNSFARQTITAERVHIGNATTPAHTCTECGGYRMQNKRYLDPHDPRVRAWLYRFHVDDDQGSRHSGPIADGKLFYSRGCAESYIGRSFDETA